MIADRYKEIDELVNFNEKTLMDVVAVCNTICDGNVSFGKLAE